MIDDQTVRVDGVTADQVRAVMSALGRRAGRAGTGASKRRSVESLRRAQRAGVAARKHNQIARKLAESAPN